MVFLPFVYRIVPKCFLITSVIISRRPIGPEREIIKWLKSVHLSVRASFVTLYKRLHTSLVYEHKFTKLTQKVYVNKGMSFIIFGPILRSKMAIFRFYFSSFFITPLLWLCYIHISQLFWKN